MGDVGCRTVSQISGGDAEAVDGQVGARGTVDSLTMRREMLLERLSLSIGHLSPLQRTQLEDHIASFSVVFALDATELGTTDLTEHSIQTGDQLPIRQSARRVPFALRDTVDALVKDMLAQGVVVPSASPWASPVVLVRKKDGGTRQDSV